MGKHVCKVTMETKASVTTHSCTKLQAESSRVSACKIKQHRLTDPAPRVGGDAEGEGGGQGESDSNANC